MQFYICYTAFSTFRLEVSTKVLLASFTMPPIDKGKNVLRAIKKEYNKIVGTSKDASLNEIHELFGKQYKFIPVGLLSEMVNEYDAIWKECINDTNKYDEQDKIAFESVCIEVVKKYSSKKKKSKKKTTSINEDDLTAVDEYVLMSKMLGTIYFYQYIHII